MGELFDLENMSYRERKALVSCVVDTDDDHSVYYTSFGDCRVHKYDSTGLFVWAVDGPCPFEAYFTDSNEGSMITPVIWDLDVDGDDIYTVTYDDGIIYKYRMM